MTRPSLDTVIDALAADARPVTSLPPPALRATSTLVTIIVFGAAGVYLLSDAGAMRELYSGREAAFGLEMTAILATGLLAITAAFFASIPGRSRWWRTAPLPAFAAWLILSGAGCYGDLVRNGASGWVMGESVHCLVFIVATSALLAGPVVWRLSRAAPIEPLPVALLGGLGIAAFSAFILQFFHPFAVTFLDLAVHLVAILAVVVVIALLNRRALGSA